MIEARNISYSVRDKTLLTNVSATLQPGKVTAILGPNGAGKSTLLKCLSGAIKPTEGEVLLEGKNMADYSLKELATKRAVLSQSTPINFPFTVMDIVMMGRNPYGTDEDADIAKEALLSVDGWELKDRIFPSLSGGEQQRVQLARVLAQLWQQEDAVLFLDEPTSALDLKHQHQVLEHVSSLAHTKHTTICVILHDLHLTQCYADHTILLKNGTVYASGITSKTLDIPTISSLFDVPSNALIKNIIAA